MNVYRTGAGKKCIIWCYDIYGFEVIEITKCKHCFVVPQFVLCQGGRTRQLCDMLADAGYLVILPDFFRGEWRVGSYLLTLFCWNLIKS